MWIHIGSKKCWSSHFSQTYSKKRQEFYLSIITWNIGNFVFYKIVWKSRLKMPRKNWHLRTIPFLWLLAMLWRSMTCFTVVHYIVREKWVLTLRGKIKAANKSSQQNLGCCKQVTTIQVLVTFNFHGMLIFMGQFEDLFTKQIGFYST